jgi:hypothetical protein
LRARVHVGVVEGIAAYCEITEWYRLGLLRTGERIQLRGDYIGKGEALVEPRSVLLTFGAQGPNDAAPKIREHRIPITRTPLRLGGSRPWFQCPKCHKRRELLFMVDATFACRRCYRLTYASTREMPGCRKAMVARQIRAMLGASADDGPEFPPKPKWMRWPTYRAWKRKEEEAVRAAKSDRPQRPRSKKWLDPIYQRPLAAEMAESGLTATSLPSRSLLADPRRK